MVVVGLRIVQVDARKIAFAAPRGGESRGTALGEKRRADTLPL
jgi:hypothetical protein